MSACSDGDFPMNSSCSRGHLGKAEFQGALQGADPTVCFCLPSLVQRHGKVLVFFFFFKFYFIAVNLGENGEEGFLHTRFSID